MTYNDRAVIKGGDGLMARYSGLDPQKYIRIREAAIELIYERGEEKVTIEQIARRAGIAKGTVYLYFSSKEYLVREVFWYCHRGEAEAGDAGIDQLPTACDKLKQRVYNLLRWAVAHPKEHEIEARYYRIHPFTSDGTPPLILHHNAQKRLIEEGIRNGEFKPLPLPLLGELINSASSGVITYAIRYPEILEDPALMETILESIVAGLRADPQGGKP